MVPHSFSNLAYYNKCYNSNLSVKGITLILKIRNKTFIHRHNYYIFPFFKNKI